jgi:hypothetical protein
MNRAERRSHPHGRTQRLEAKLDRIVPGARLLYCPDPAPPDAVADGATPGRWHLRYADKMVVLHRDPGPWVVGFLIREQVRA